MRYQVMNQTDLKLSNLCLGGAGFGDRLNLEQSFEILDAFVRAGGNFIDTANIYCRWVPGLENCSEIVLGEWLKARGAYRDVVIATKGAHYLFDTDEKISRVNEKEIRKDLEESLKTLGADVIDFYWLHRDDESRPIEEIVDILEKLKQEGRSGIMDSPTTGFTDWKQPGHTLPQKGCRVRMRYPISGAWLLLIRERIQIRILRWWNFQEKSLNGIRRQGLHRFRFLPLPWVFLRS